MSRSTKLVVINTSGDIPDTIESLINRLAKPLPIKRVKPDHKEIRVFGGFNTRYRIMEVDRERLDRLANKIKLTPLGNKLKGEKNGET